MRQITLPILVLAVLHPTGLIAQSVPPANASGSVVELSPFTVNVAQDRGYQATTAISATKLSTAVYELPFSVSIATEEFIRDLGTPDLQETLRFLGNVERTFNPEATGQYTIRGTALGAQSVYVNSRLVNNAVADTYNISRIEVAKGPASTTMGVSSAVGVVNYLVKKPDERSAFQSVTARIGSNDNHRGTFDVNVPYRAFGRSGGVRVMGVYEDSKDFIPFLSRKTKGVTLTNLTRLTDTLLVDLYLEHLTMDRIQSATMAQAGIGHVGARPPYGSGGGWDANLRDINGANIPLPTPVSIGGVNVTTGAFTSGIYDLRTLASIGGPENGQNFGSFNADVSTVWQPMKQFNLELFYSAGRQYKEDIRKEATTTIRYSGVRVANGVALVEPGVGRYFQRQFVTYQPQLPVWRHYGRISGFYNLELPITTQMLRFGAEVFDQGDRELEISRITTPNTTNAIMQDVYLDDITAATTSIARWYAAGGTRTPIQHSLLPDQSYKAYYLTAQGRYWENRIRTVLGIRRDEARQRAWAGYTVPIGRTYSDDPLVMTSDITYRADSPLYSISVEPVKWFNVYYNRAESFSFNQAGAPLLNYAGTANDDPAQALAAGRFDRNNPGSSPPPPETGKGEEYGVKVSLLGGRLSATVARYSNERVNIRTSWPRPFIEGLLGATDPRVSQGFTAAGVVQEAKGWEVEVQASPTENLTFAANYSEPKLTFTANPTNPNTVGIPNAGNFKSTFNFLGRYLFTQGRLKGFVMGTAVQYRGPFLLTSNNGGFYNSAQTIWNPFVGYDIGRRGRTNINVRLDVHNVFDTAYTVSHIIGEPRAVFLSATLRFK